MSKFVSTTIALLCLCAGMPATAGQVNGNYCEERVDQEHRRKNGTSAPASCDIRRRNQAYYDRQDAERKKQLEDMERFLERDSPSIGDHAPRPICLHDNITFTVCR